MRKTSANFYFALLYCVIALAMVSLPGALTPFVPGTTERDTVRADGSFEFSTSFGLRKQLIALDASIKTTLFGESPNEEVVFGRDGWLFLSETLDKNAAPNRPSGLAAVRIARTLKLIDEYINKNGARFLFVVAPNKARVYGEYLPYYAPWPGSMEKILYDRLLERLDELGVPYIDLGGTFMRLKEENPDVLYYHRLDSHWNNLGALEAYRAVMAHMGMAMAEGVGNAAGDRDDTSDRDDAFGADLFTYADYSGTEPRIERDWPGDLDRMLNPMSERTDIQYYYDIKNIYRSRKPIVNPEEMNISSTSDVNGVRVLFFRDSFANSLIQFFSNNLGEAAYTRAVPFPLGRAEGGAYDFVVAEIVERNLDWIVKAAPPMPAPLRARRVSSETDTGDAAAGAGGITAEDTVANAGGITAEDTAAGAWGITADDVAARYAAGSENDAESGSVIYDTEAAGSGDLPGMASLARQLPDDAVYAEFAEPPPDAPPDNAGRISGYVEPAYVSADGETRVYAVFEGGEGRVQFIFEAFPILEENIRGRVYKLDSQDYVANHGTDIADCGFSFKINGEELPEGTYEVKILLVPCDSSPSSDAECPKISKPMLIYSK